MHPEDGRFSEYASVFYLKDLKEVSEQTNDAVKFICDHEVLLSAAWARKRTCLCQQRQTRILACSVVGGCIHLFYTWPPACTTHASSSVCRKQVIGTVRIKKILNPDSWQSADTYLKIEVSCAWDEEKRGRSGTVRVPGF